LKLIHPYIPFAPVGYTPLGSTVDENDLRDYEIELCLIEWLIQWSRKNENYWIKKKEKYATTSQKQYILTQEKIQEKKESMREIGFEWDKHKQNLTNIQSDISAILGVLIPGATPGGNPEYKRLLKKEADENSTITTMEKYLNGTLARELKDLETEAIRLKEVSDRFKNEYEEYNTIDIPNKEKEIEDANLVVIQAQENLKQNQDEMQKVKNKIKETTQKYTHIFNITNRDRYSVQQDINESEEDYLNRIKQIESQPYDPTILKEKTVNEGNLLLMTNLRNSSRDEVN
jgi:hypothetical protein